MKIKQFEPKPFEKIYDEYYMEHAQKLGSGSFGKVYLIQVVLSLENLINKIIFVAF